MADLSGEEIDIRLLLNSGQDHNADHPECGGQTHDLRFLPTRHGTREMAGSSICSGELYQKIYHILGNFLRPHPAGNDGFNHVPLMISYPRLRCGGTLQADGVSLLQYSVTNLGDPHKHCFDPGATLYHHLSQLSRVIKSLIRRLRP